MMLCSPSLIIPRARRRRCIVENSNLAVRHHIVDETDVHPLPPAVGIAHARIDPCGCDLRNADAASMLTDFVANVSEHAHITAPSAAIINTFANRELVP
jgi:hypothetical protein